MKLQECESCKYCQKRYNMNEYGYHIDGYYGCHYPPHWGKHIETVSVCHKKIKS